MLQRGSSQEPTDRGQGSNFYKYRGDTKNNGLAMQTNIPQHPKIYDPRSLDLVWSEFNQKRFQDTHRIAYIVLDLNLSGIPASLQSEQVQKIARKYHNGVSRYLFGKKARRGKSQANLLIHHHPKPQHHLHMLLQIPENRNFRQVRDFTYEFILKNRERFIPQRDALCHFEETRNLIGSTIYNQKFGSDSILIF
jgi:hypothetical protein